MSIKYGTEEMKTHLAEQEAKLRGRPKGSRNRRNKDAKALAEKIGDPLELLLRIAHNRRVSLPDRIKSATAACSYIWPRLSVSHVNFEGQIDHNVEVSRVLQLARDPEMAALMERLSIELSMQPRPETLELLPESQMLPEPDGAKETADNDSLFFPDDSTLGKKYNPPKPADDSDLDL